MADKHNFHKCDEDRCFVCNGGIGFCETCKGGEGTLSTHCCGRKLSELEEKRIAQGILDYLDGHWRVRRTTSERWVSLPTQAGRATELATAIAGLAPQIARIETELAVLLGESQNAAPDGAADGTIDAERWARMRDVHDALFKLNVLLRGGE